MSYGQRGCWSWTKRLPRSTLRQLRSSRDPDSSGRKQCGKALETVLTIAHCLHTIIGYATCLGLENGLVVEHDGPLRLLSQPESLLSGLDAETQTKLKEIAKGQPRALAHANASTNDINQAPVRNGEGATARP